MIYAGVKAFMNQNSYLSAKQTFQSRLEWYQRPEVNMLRLQLSPEKRWQTIRSWKVRSFIDADKLKAWKKAENRKHC